MTIPLCHLENTKAKNLPMCQQVICSGYIRPATNTCNENSTELCKYIHENMDVLKNETAKYDEH